MPSSHKDNQERWDPGFDATPPPPPLRPAGGARAQTDAPGERRFPCHQCGAAVVFEPGTTALACPYCGARNEIPADDRPIAELDFFAHLRSAADNAPTDEVTTLKCAACAAEFERPANVESLSCPYCGADIVAVGIVRRLIKPASLLPFRVTNDQARSHFRKWLGKLWFAPGKLKQFARLDSSLTGLYVPYWTYDAHTTSAYTGARGEHYWVTVGSGKNRRRERRTRWYPASGVVRVPFDDVLVLGSKTLPAGYAEKLEPWDLPNLVPYRDEYLSGFVAEAYQVDLVGGFQAAKQIMAGTIRDAIARDIGGDTQQIHSVDTSYANVTFKHLLLPIWVGGYRWRKKVYQFLVNARTGEVQGQRPYSAFKITMFILAILAVIAIFVFWGRAASWFGN